MKLLFSISNNYRSSFYCCKNVIVFYKDTCICALWSLLWLHVWLFFLRKN